MSTKIAAAPVQPPPQVYPGASTVPRVMASALAPLSVRCPFCRAPRGSQCRSRTGYTGGIHAARRKAVAHLSDAERLAAYDLMRAEQDARRTQTVQALAECANDPEIQATRRATGAAWARICRETAGVS